MWFFNRYFLFFGDIGSGKSYIAKQFGYPVFNADNEVAKLYRKDKKVFNKLLKLPEKTLVYPAHDYNGKKKSTIENEKKIVLVGNFFANEEGLQAHALSIEGREIKYGNNAWLLDKKNG